jgi:hypothetical protein
VFRDRDELARRLPDVAELVDGQVHGGAAAELGAFAHERDRLVREQVGLAQGDTVVDVLEEIVVRPLRGSASSLPAKDLDLVSPGSRDIDLGC